MSDEIGDRIAEGYRRIPPGQPDEWGDIGGVTAAVVTPLNPIHVGDWLAAVGLHTWRPGRWVSVDGGQNWDYVLDGGPPTVVQVRERLEDLAAQPGMYAPDGELSGARWLRHVGQARVDRTVRDVLGDLEGLPGDEPVPLDDYTGLVERTLGWMIDERWRRAPGAHGGALPTIPAGKLALALVGAHVMAGRPGHWPQPMRAVGHLWDSALDEHRLDEWVVTWLQQRRDGEPHSGALGEGKIRRLRAPSWAEHVTRVFAVARQDLISVEEAAELLGVTRAEVRAAVKSGQQVAGVRLPAPLVTAAAKGDPVWGARQFDRAWWAGRS